MRFTKISARELLFKRDQTTGDALEIKDSAVSDLQYQRRRRDNNYTCKVKDPGIKTTKVKKVTLVIIRGEKEKSRNRDTYVIKEVHNDETICIKTNTRSL